MKSFIRVASVGLVACLTSSFSLAATNLMDVVKATAAAKDDLGLRVVAQRILSKKPQAGVWKSVRNELHRHPGVGWDLLQAWDAAPPKTALSKSQTDLSAKIHEADELMSAGQFKKATPLYESIAFQLREKGVAFGQANFFLYQSVLHSLARSYYGQGSFADAILVDQWISVLYPYIREVQFEKMWAGSRSNDPSVTLGAIASQTSSYFSRYLEPEAYLVQYYTYKGLCRTADLKQVTKAIVSYKKALDENRIRLQDWVNRDNETLILWRLVESGKDAGSESSLVSKGDRQRERAAVKASLQKRYDADLIRLKDQMQKVVAYLDLSQELQNADLPTFRSTDRGRVEGVEKFLKSDNEMWPVQDA